MGDKRKIGLIVGSLRKASYNRAIANALIEMAPDSLDMGLVEIDALTLYNQDFDNASPPEWVAFRDQIRPLDGLIFCTPEYNRSIPGVLKNAIDIGSRPYGKSVWGPKSAGVVSVSPGSQGGVSSHHDLRKVLGAVGVAVMPLPEVAIAGADKLLDAQGKLINEGTRGFLGKFLAAYAVWVEKHKAV